MIHTTVLNYDRDTNGKRLHKNAKALALSNNGSLELELVNVNRVKDFINESGAETLLLQEPFLYDAIIINGQGLDSNTVVEDAMIALELNGLGNEKIIYVDSREPSGNPPYEGVHWMCAHGGNGHLLPQDADEILKILRELGKEQ